MKKMKNIKEEAVNETLFYSVEQVALMYLNIYSKET